VYKVYKNGWAPPASARAYCPTTSVGKAGSATQEVPQVRDTSRTSVAQPTRRPGGWSEEIENQPAGKSIIYARRRWEAYHNIFRVIRVKNLFRPKFHKEHESELEIDHNRRQVRENQNGNPLCTRKEKEGC